MHLARLVLAGNHVVGEERLLDEPGHRLRHVSQGSDGAIYILEDMPRQRILKLTAPDDHMVLPEIISKEPLGPVVRQGDDQWFNIVRWSLFAMINAEELGVTSQNVDDMKSSDSPNIQRLVGVDGNFGTELGLTNEWAYNIIKHVGNYGEVYEATVGPDTPLKLERGVNALWSKGGIQYAPPIR